MNKENYIKELFVDVIGQDSSIRLLRSALEKERISTAYLFSGPEGVGKKLTAMRFLECLIHINSKSKFIRKRLENRNHPDLMWIEPTYSYQGNLIAKSNANKEKRIFRTLPQIRLDQIKDLKKFLSGQPIESKWAMVVIENVEDINESAANALLKTLEEPNKGIFILTTERPELLLDTIRSRCQFINFHRLSHIELKEVFQKKLSHINNNLDTGFKQKELLELSNGSPGAILKNIEIWEQIPHDLWPKLKSFPSDNPMDALSTAKDIIEALDSQQQLWLISWLQQYIWLKNNDVKAVKGLDKLRYHIKSFVNQRLAWEIALLNLNKIN